MTSLVVVESPAKSKTIEKYLGKGYKVLASYGHVRDLLAKEGAVDPSNGYAMKYQLIEKNEKHVAALKKAIVKCDELLLATDPDREGEAIAHHIYVLLEEAGCLENVTVRRIAFYEITKHAVQAAIENPRELSQDLVNAQQARRALDYLYGFTLSPLLWKKIRPGLSAGRVQSPALRMLAERQLAINAFEPQEYWTLEAGLLKDKKAFGSKLIILDNEKLKQFTLNSEAKTTKAHQTIEKAAKGQLLVSKLEEKSRKRNPAPPFTTSTLQQEASRKLGFTASRTMRIAQQLYEGIDLGEGAAGLITYMRTDSVNIAESALEEIRDLIASEYGADHMPDAARRFKSKAKNAQEAHEAIRPTIAASLPKHVKQHLKPEQAKLYELIWKRTIACQMTHAVVNTLSADLTCGEGAHIFRATGSVIKEPGFLRVYEEGQDDVADSDKADVRLPALKEGEMLDIQELRSLQHFTEPPPRFTEATLVKSLEEYGIGRPSTYAAILSTLQARGYATLDKKRFFTTDVGMIVAKFLTDYFTHYVDYDFTAKLEDDLDSVAQGSKEWVPLLDGFWQPFQTLVKHTETSVSRSDVTHEALDEACPDCEKPLSIRLGKRGRFVGCTAYPECKYTRSMEGEETRAEPELVEDRKCPKCESDLHIKAGRYGKFIGCSGYPKCKHMEPLEKPQDTGVQCPECKKANLFSRKSRYGKLFYSCERYPDCKYAVWNYPVGEACPTCEWPFTTVKTTKRRGTERVCPQKECDFAEPRPDLAPKEEEA